jgi:hypothetical protein
MRIELDETALVRPSNAASDARRVGGIDDDRRQAAGESSAEASARPTSPPPKMITSARSMARAPSAQSSQLTPRSSLDRGLRVEAF